MPKPPPRDDELVIFVHGTSFSGTSHELRLKWTTRGADEVCDDEAWWKPGSANWRWFQEHLPSGTTLGTGPHERFTWTGKNSQVNRLDAGNDLLALLLYLERKGRTYHLVGHSHGGSVIWEALISAEITRRHQTVYAELRRALNRPWIRQGEPTIMPERIDEHWPTISKVPKTRHFPDAYEYRRIQKLVELRGLRSWTTVGAPFMQYFPTGRPFSPGWKNSRFSLVSDSPRRELRKQLVELLLVLSMTGPIFLILAMFVGGLLHADWVRSFGNSDVANALAMPAFAWWIFSWYALAKRNYASTLMARQYAAHHAFHRFGERWLGLWSPSDEAINSLTSLAPSTPEYEWFCASAASRPARPDAIASNNFPLPRIPIPGAIAETHLLPNVLRIAALRAMNPLRWLIQRLVEPIIRRKIADALTRNAHGADLPASQLAFVSPWPLPLRRAREFPGLPREVSDRIDSHVEQRTGQVRPVMREMLMTAALQGAPTAVAALRSEHSATTKGLLVHTSYFDDLGVRELIVRRIACTRVTSETIPDDDQVHWLNAQTDAVQTEFRPTQRSS